VKKRGGQNRLKYFWELAINAVTANGCQEQIVSCGRGRKSKDLVTHKGVVFEIARGKETQKGGWGGLQEEGW